MKKILFFIGSRANYSSIKSVMQEVKKKLLKLQIILGASGLINKYGELEKSLKKDGFKIDKKIYFLIEGENSYNGKINWTWSNWYCRRFR